MLSKKSIIKKNNIEELYAIGTVAKIQIWNFGASDFCVLDAVVHCKLQKWPTVGHTDKHIDIESSICDFNKPLA